MLKLFSLSRVKAKRFGHLANLPCASRVLSSRANKRQHFRLHLYASDGTATH